MTSPLIFHRKEIANGEPPFRFRSDQEFQQFQQSLFDVLCAAHFTSIYAIVPLDTSLEPGQRLVAAYAKALPFLLFRYCGYLHRFKGRGDVYAETIGERENGFLKHVYSRVRHIEGGEGEPASYFSAVLTSKHLHVEEKVKNYAGLQVADLLATPIMRWCLSIPGGKPFDLSMSEVGQYKLNKRFCDGLTSEGYGVKVFQE